MANRGNGLGTFSASANGVVYLEGIRGLTFAPWEITRPAPPFRMSYGLNRRVHGDFDGPRFRGARLPYTDVFALRRRDNIPLLLDAVAPGAGFVFERQRPPNHEPSGAAGQTCINRHDGTINGLFLDWSVRPIGLKELWTLKWHLQWDTAGPWTKAGGVRPEDWPQWMRKFKDY
jgi:prepilin-type processing-associated H-X9-DG protein